MWGENIMQTLDLDAQGDVCATSKILQDMPLCSTENTTHLSNRFNERPYPLKQTAEKENWELITPVPSDAKVPPKTYPKFGKLTGRWPYRDKDGKILCYVDRFLNLENKKTYLPLTYYRNNVTGIGQWERKGLNGSKPLYNLDKLAKFREAIVVMVEGEKCADAAMVLFPLPKYVTTTILNGCQSASKADFKPLIGRNVWLWPDNDEPGKSGMGAIGNALKKQGTENVSLFSLDSFLNFPNGTQRESLPKGWDVADAVIEGFSAEFIQSILPHSLMPFASLPLPEDKLFQSNVSPYRNIVGDPILKDGLYFDTKRKKESLLWICSPLYVITETRDYNSDNWGYELVWKDSDGHPHTWVMPAELLTGNGEEFCKELRARGLKGATSISARNHLINYIDSSSTENRAICINKTGWFNGVFVFPNQIIGDSTDKILYQTSSSVVSPYCQKGSLAQWREEVSTLCQGNSRLLLSLCAALAPPLLEYSDNDNGGFHFVGASSQGKSTALHVAGSVYGGRNYIHNWNATGNGLESIAANHSDTLLVLDELGQVNGNEVGNITYMLANGTGKQRAYKCANARDRAKWKLLLLSSGETDLPQHMLQSGKIAKAGQEVRLLSVDADAGAGHGIYENLHGLQDGAALSAVLNEKTNQFFGTAGPAFIGFLAKNLNALPRTIKEYTQKFIQQNMPKNASGQVDRALKQFALCVAAGKLAIEYGVVNLQVEDIEDGIKKCFEAWIEQRGGVGNQEHETIIKQIRHFFQTHGASRFAPWDNYGPGTIYSMAGYRKEIKNGGGGWEYYVFTETFERELCEGFSSRMVSKLLIERGHIKRDSRGKRSHSVTLPNSEQRRVYIFNQTLWED